MEAKTKLITSIVAVSLVAVFSIVGLIIVLAAYTANLTNSYNISYTANGVACDVSASYRKATTGETTAGTYTTIKSGTSDKITFTGKDTTSTGEGGVSASFNSLSDQALTKNQYFVLRYIIENNKSNSIDMVVSLNITTTTDPVNFNVSYAYSTNSTDLSTNLTTNRSNFSDTFTAKELKSGSTAYIYVLCEIANLELDAGFIGTANWELVDANDYEINYNYAEIKSGDYVRKAIFGINSASWPSSAYAYYNETVRSVTFGSYADYANVVANVANTSIVNTASMDVPGFISYDGGENTIDVSSNTDGSVMLYRVKSGSYFDVYILAMEALTKIDFNTSCSYMFEGLYGLSNIEFGNAINTSNVTNMYRMFATLNNDGGMINCSLTTLDLTMFDTSSVTNMGEMFYRSRDLNTLNLSGWDTSSVTDMSNMFSFCSGLSTLDLSGWDTSSVTSMTSMFFGCSGLTTIYVSSSWNTAKVTSSSSMFNNCTQLVGGNGTKYNSYYTDKTYARVDTPSTPGYLTLKS